MRSASPGSGSRSCAMATTLRPSGFASKPTTIRVPESPQSKRADLGLVAVRSRSSPSGSQLPFCAGAFGATYLVCSVLLGAAFIAGAYRLMRQPSRRTALRLYLFSLAYLALLFGAMVADARL